MKQNCDVRVLVRRNSTNQENLKHLNVEIFYGDLCQPHSLRPAVKGVSKVFHCAGVASDWAPKRVFSKVNVTGTLNLLKACAREAEIDRFIAISTNDVFGIVENQIIDESLPLKKWNEPYPDSKILADRLAWRFYRQLDFPVTMVYPCWVYGPGDTTFLPHLIRALKKRELVFWRRNSLLWPAYIENLVDLMLLIADEKRAVGNGYLIHDGECFTLEAFANLWAQALDLQPVHTHIPYGLAYGTAVLLETLWKLFHIRTRPMLTTYVVRNLGSRLRFSIKKAERELSWKPKLSFEEGFKRTLKWLRENA